MRLEDFKPSISRLSPDDAFILVRRLRENRMLILNPPKPEPKPEKTRRKKKGPTKKEQATLEYLKELGLDTSELEKELNS